MPGVSLAGDSVKILQLLHDGGIIMTTREGVELAPSASTDVISLPSCPHLTIRAAFCSLRALGAVLAILEHQWEQLDLNCNFKAKSKEERRFICLPFQCQSDITKKDRSVFLLTILTQGSRNNVKLVHNVVPLSNSCSMGSIQAHSMNLINKGQSSITVSYITQLVQRTNATWRPANVL